MQQRYLWISLDEYRRLHFLATDHDIYYPFVSIISEYLLLRFMVWIESTGLTRVSRSQHAYVEKKRCKVHVCNVFFGITYLSWSEKFNEIIQQVFGIHLQLGLVSRTTDLTLAVHNWHISDSLSTKLLVRFVKWNALLWCLEYYSAGRSW